MAYGSKYWGWCFERRLKRSGKTMINKEDTDHLLGEKQVPLERAPK